MWSEEIEEPRIPEKLFKIIDTKDSNIVIKHSIHILFMFYMFDFVHFKF